MKAEKPAGHLGPVPHKAPRDGALVPGTWILILGCLDEDEA